MGVVESICDDLEQCTKPCRAEAIQFQPTEVTQRLTPTRQRAAAAILVARAIREESRRRRQGETTRWSLALTEAERQVAQLQEAMSSRAVIEQAKGMLMLRMQVDADEAFRTLVGISQRTQRKLRDIAAILAEDAAQASRVSRR